MLHDTDGLIVAVLVGSGGLGGAERSTIELAAADRAAGGRFVVLARDRGEGAISQLADRLDVPLVRVKGLTGAVRVLRHLRPSVVWPFGLRWSLSLRLLVQRPLVRDPRGRRPVVFAAQRGLDTWRRPWHNLGDVATQRLVDRFVANSYAARNMLVEKVGIDPQRAVAIWSGVSDEWLQPLRTREGCDVVRVIVVGTNRDEKGHPDALVALAALAERDDWVATVYTSGGTGLDVQLHTHGLEERVTVVRNHALTPADYDAADVLLHSSRAESLPRAVLEALARGLSVVATDVGDVADLVGPCGRVVPAAEIEAMVAALDAAIETARGPVPADVAQARQDRCPRQATVVRDLRALIGSLDA
ncbi:MAG TPA: glycosyltransferase family 4 protein [Acidimicrobiales bacterium]